MATDTAELRYFNAREVARTLRISDGHALKIIASGQIRAIRIGRTIRVSADAIREYERSFSSTGQEPATGQDANANGS